MRPKRSLVGYGHRWQGQGLALIYTDHTDGSDPRGLCIRGRRCLHVDAITGEIEVRS